MPVRFGPHELDDALLCFGRLRQQRCCRYSEHQHRNRAGQMRRADSLLRPWRLSSSPAGCGPHPANWRPVPDFT